jgi:hypothetical protein
MAFVFALGLLGECAAGGSHGDDRPIGQAMSADERGREQAGPLAHMQPGIEVACAGVAQRSARPATPTPSRTIIERKCSGFLRGSPKTATRLGSPFPRTSLELTPYRLYTIMNGMATVVSGDFEWDDAKAEANLRKHGVSFEEATTAFEDANHLIVDDGSGDSETYWLIGFSIAGRLLTVVHVERGPRERIISARRTTAEDERRYRKGQGEPSEPAPGKTKAERRRALTDVGCARLDALRGLGFVVPGDDGRALPPRGPRGGLWRPLEQYGLMYEGPARRLLGLSPQAFRTLVLPTAWVKNPVHSTAPQVGIYDSCTLIEIAGALREDRTEWLAQCREFVSRRREQIDAEVRVEHDDFMRRARNWQALRRERAEERRYWARAVGSRTENVRGDQP